MLAFKLAPKDFLKETGKEGSLSEIYGGNQKMPEFAIISPSGVQIGEWMKCKDYIQDAVWATKKNVSYEIYGFKFDIATDKVSLNRLILAVRWPGKKAVYLKECLDNVKATVEDIEKRLKIPKYKRTRFARVRKGNAARSYFVVYGSPAWMHCIAAVSFFTWLIRAALTNDGGRIDTLDSKKFAVSKDAYYFKGGKKFIDMLKKGGFSAFQPDWNKEDVYKVHNNGFVTFSGGNMYGDEPDNGDEDEDWEF